MGIGIQCILKPEVPSAESFFTDGKNIAEAFMGALMGGFDFGALEGEFTEEPETESDDAEETFAKELHEAEHHGARAEADLLPACVVVSSVTAR